jgi:plasmid maintenance system antidote protein VapI
MKKKHTQLATERGLKVMRDLLHKNRVESRLAFAKSIGIERTGVTEIINGQRTFTTENLIEICLQYDINPEWLFLGNGTQHKTNLKKLRSVPELIATASALLDEASEKVLGDKTGDKTSRKKAL